MSKLYDAELSEVIKTRLTQLEAKPKPPSKVPARQIIEQFRETARQAMAKGYTLAEIREIAQEAGLEISLSTLKTYLRSRKAKKKAPQGKRKAEVKAAKGKPDTEEAIAAVPQNPTMPTVEGETGGEAPDDGLR